MKKLLLFLLPIFTYAQITKVPNDGLGEHIGLHIIYFLGRVNGGVSLGKLPDVNGSECLNCLRRLLSHKKQRFLN